MQLDLRGKGEAHARQVQTDLHGARALRSRGDVVVERRAAKLLAGGWWRHLVGTRAEPCQSGSGDGAQELHLDSPGRLAQGLTLVIVRWADFFPTARERVLSKYGDRCRAR